MAVTIEHVISFGSDNHSGVHPQVMAAMAQANSGHTGAYGDDPWTRQAEDALQAVFGDNSVPILVANGTGANLIALQACLARPWDAVVCSDVAHINVDEGGAPERILGSKLVALPTTDGRIAPEQLAATCERRGDEHAVQPAVLSVTQSSEYGTVYTAEQARALAAEARRLGMYVHVDGARLANAAVALGCDLGDVAELFDADVVSFGGTKNGLMGAEAVVFRNPALADQAKWIRKATTQLISKHRYLAAQFIAVLSDDLWRRNAENANAMAQRLASGLSDAGVVLTQPVEVNAVFALLPDAEELMQRFHFYPWLAPDEVRLMCSWDTTADDVDDFVAAVRAR
ncbi:MAG: aminotransferase class I/II-fold pyridoxal phosphate-dependent enzyme [Candidatus Nanopelagicales bacterium]|jgi:threonine aldolase|nr:aminotransferase class I/II-fold pyridoxal phosphate-dependent enzyme [Candidatus Nanopelagicales bacterium]MCU0296494.1 aminotransferase class I/II-fold pyridoxal phosphate-dependent enzyme [Candidatus Nanopelagicales bacterium]